MTEAIPPRDAITSALRELGDATTSEIRARTGLGKTTVNDHLRQMVTDGSVEKHGIPARYRLAQSVGADDLPETGEWEYKHPGGDAEPMPSTEDTPALASANVDDVLSYMETVAPAPTEAELAEDEATGTPRKKAETRHDFCSFPVEREQEDGTKKVVPCGAPIHTEGRSWIPDQGTVEEHGHKPTTKAFREPREKREPKEGGMTNPHGAAFAKGELKSFVTAWLQDPSNRDSDHTVAEIAKALNAYPGSTAFILKKLDAEGVVKLTQPKPAKYQAA